MKKTTLVIMAAGMGSRFGGPKQIAPVGPCGEKIIDYSVFDAIRAGFNEVIFVLSDAIEKDFKECIGDRVSKHIPVKYAIQRLSDLPNGYSVPEGRTKPWGTGQAVLVCKDLIDAPFTVINADDFYGRHGFEMLHDFLVNIDESDRYKIAMAGYHLCNTITDKGSVSRGICEVSDKGKLLSITERTKIYTKDDGICFLEDDREEKLADNAVTSMNCWAFDHRVLPEFEKEFVRFLENLGDNPLKAEFFLPSVVNDLVAADKAEVSVRITPDKWYGLTYAADREDVVKALAQLTKEGVYPENLWNA